jgi:hypothetical protein
MSCLPNRTTEQASGQSQVVVSRLATGATFLSDTAGNFPVSELAFEAEMHQRAGVITDVLARIMERPAAPRYWGLNE